MTISSYKASYFEVYVGYLFEITLESSVESSYYDILIDFHISILLVQQYQSV